MYVILTYDVNKKRCNKVMKSCSKYLQHVQNSVFEGMITEAKLKKLKKQLAQIINIESDAVCIYVFDSLKYSRKEQLGIVIEHEHVII